MSSTAAPERTPWQVSLFASQEPELDDLGRTQRRHLDRDTWIDVLPGWLRGADELFVQLRDALPWETGKRPMYDRMVDVPRLSAFLPLDDPHFPALVTEAAAALGVRYQIDFAVVGANYYRSGADSVAWHRDRIGRHEKDPLVVVLSLGGRRHFRLRPLGGGAGITVPLDSGDLLVMGGACQHRWEHAVPKMATREPRMSLTFRHADHTRSDDPVNGLHRMRRTA